MAEEAATITLACEDVSISVPNGAGGSRTLLEDFSAEFASGHSYGIVGRSGAGKSTLIATLSLMRGPTKGEVLFHGEPTSHMSDATKAHLRNHAFGYVFQDFALIEHLTVEQNVMLPLLYGDSLPRNERRARVQAELARVGMDDFLSARPSVLSGGERQRVALARALVREPAIVVADEPTGALDASTGHKVVSELLDITRERNATLIVVTHDDAVAERLGTVLRFENASLRPVAGASC